MTREFRRVAIVNRGEAAVRFVHAARELSAEGVPITSIALYTEAERHALFVREADEAWDLGPAAFVDPRDGQRKPAYLDYERLARTLEACRAEAVWVGWGFVAEHAAFADLCGELGIVFIGPSGDVMRRLGDKIASKQLAESAGVPVVPWSGGAVETLEAARKVAATIGFPLMIKATAGGGGRGIRRVAAEPDLAEAFERARSEAVRAFGDGTVFMECQVQGARHIEVQVVADHHGHAWALGVRDCSVQRRNQKVIEEAPSPALSPEQDASVRAAAERLVRAAGYQNAGTVEFLFDNDGQYWFMEVNARLQVEHPVTEMTTGADLVKLQVSVARGLPLVGDPPAPRGHAIEVRLNAEDPDNDFAPAPGQVEQFRVPSGPGLRVDAGVSEGDLIPRDFDSMIAKFIAWGRDRREALARLRRGLAQTRVVVRDGTTNKAFLLDLLTRPEVRDGQVDVGWLDRQMATGDLGARDHAAVALVRAAIEAYEAELDLERNQFFAWAGRGRPQAPSDVGRTVELGYGGHTYRARVRRVSAGHHYCVRFNGVELPVSVVRVGNSPVRERRAQGSEWSLTCCGRTHRVLMVTQSLGYLIEVDGVAHRISRDSAGVVRATAPAIVVSIAVAPGDEVQAGDRLAVVEAMKMEMALRAPFAGRVREVGIAPGVQVGTGQPLVVLDPLETSTDVPARERVSFGALGSPSELTPAQRRRRVLDDFLALVLGYDIDPPALSAALQEWQAVNADLAIDGHAEALALEDRVLDAFVDICALFDRRPEDDGSVRRAPTSNESHLFSYLRTLDISDERLPAAFVTLLSRALAHHGVASADRSPELREALFRLYKAHQREDAAVVAVTTILERRLQETATLARQAAEPSRALLDRLIAATQHRQLSVNDLAREVRYRLFEQPLLDQARHEVYAQAERELALLAERPFGADRDRHVESLVQCPQPLASVVIARLKDARAELKQVLLEVMARRYYRIRDLRQVRPAIIDGHVFVLLDYLHEGRNIQAVFTDADRREVPRVLALAQPLLEAGTDTDTALDLYVRDDRPLDDPDTNERAFEPLLGALSLPRPARRIVVGLSGPQVQQGMGGMQYFTFRPHGEGYTEEKFYRGVHPMMGKRLHLWRLANFDIERLPSVEDLYVLHGVARDNPRDERLFAVAEVRDLTPVRDEHGRIVRLPNLERMFMEAVAGLRRAQARRPVDRRLLWNRMLLYVWPRFELRPDELTSLVARLAPAMEDLGLEAVLLRCRIPDPASGELEDRAIFIADDGRGWTATFREPPTEPMRTLSTYEQKVVRARQMGLVYPYELIKLLVPPRNGHPPTAEVPAGEFFEYDIDEEGQLHPVSRPPGSNRSNIVVGVVRNFTSKHPEGITRVILLGDPTRDLGALAEPECRRIIAAIDLAEQSRVPVEWFALSAGAKISMDSGTENMDWIALVLRRLVKFTQRGGEVNVVVNGINVGAQPYWNAEATMLMHTRGILVMMPDSALVLTGKRALDYSGGVSAEDNQGIGGYERVMGPNGQAQYFASDMRDAIRILLSHYAHTYVSAGELYPRRASTADPVDRDIRSFPYGFDHAFKLVGDVFSDERNPGRKKPFDVRRVMAAVADQDHAPLERWAGWRDAEMTVVWDCHLGGWPVELIGLESRPLQRLGFLPADGPEQWTAGTLFPQSSRKMARAINAASGNRPVVILANLSGFDGSPESLRNWQLEYGAEIGRAVVNFKGPIVFCVISRYHGGAFVVFSNALNPNLEVAALEGTFASVIGGAPAAAVVFAREVEKRTNEDSRIVELERAMRTGAGAERARLRGRLADLRREVKAAKINELAEEFDRVHSIHRAKRVGSVHEIVKPASLRPYLIDAVQRGIKRELHRAGRELHLPAPEARVAPRQREARDEGRERRDETTVA
jgi:acetyl/propionyl-CoA carboxylase alpha subunit/acetyl-CoA carboxylase carboxyltransferase component